MLTAAKDAPTRLAVTLSRNASLKAHARAEAVAERCGADFYPKRPALEALFEKYDFLYMLRNGREELVNRDGTSLFVHAAMLRSKIKAGRDHPFLRAFWPRDKIAPTSVVDTTLGLCTDALHLAGATGAKVVGLETSPIIYSLAEEGIARLREDRYPQVARAARLVTPLLVDHRDWLFAQAPRSVDVLFVHPMFENPPSGGASFDLFRAFADPHPVPAAALTAMGKIARHHVGFKLRAGWRTEPAGLCWHRREEGARTDLLVHDV